MEASRAAEDLNSPASDPLVARLSADTNQHAQTAAETLWRAVAACEELSIRDGRDQQEVRTAILRSVRLLAVYVARSDGELTLDDRGALREVFARAIGMPTSRELGAQIQSDPSVVSDALDLLCSAAQSLDSQSASDCPASPAGNLICLAMEQVLQVLFDADIADAADPDRYRQVIERLNEAGRVPDPADTIDSAAVDTAFDKIASVTTPLRSPDQAAPSPTPVSCPANLNDGETCYSATAVVLYQESNVVRNVRYAGFGGRARITKGLSFRAGSYNVDRTRSPKVERIAAGTLCITDRRLIFLSDTKNLDLPYGRLLSSATTPGVIEVTRSNSGRLLFEEVQPDAISTFETVTGTSPEPREQLERVQRAARDDAMRQDVVPGTWWIIGVVLAGLLLAWTLIMRR